MKHKSTVIGVCASKTGFQSGKDTCADSIIRHVYENNPSIYIKKFSFGDPLKKICAELFNFDVNYCYTDKDKIIPNVSWPHGNKYGKTGFMTVRDILQYFGTDVMRSLNPDYWVQKTQNEINNQSALMCDVPIICKIMEIGECKYSESLFIIPDIRYPNELQICDYIIDIERPELYKSKVNSNHSSETALRDLEKITDKRIFNICNDSSIEDFEKKSIDVLNQILSSLTMEISEYSV